MDLLRAGAVATATFWALCAVYFVQPFTGSFLLVALPAAAIAVVLFVVLRDAPQGTPPAPGGPMDGAAGAATTVGILLLLLGLMFAVGRWPMLWDPCHTWGDESRSRTTTPDSPCASSSSSTQGRSEFVLMSLAGEGVLLAGGGLAIWGAQRRSPAVLAAVGSAMLSPTVVLFRGMSLFFIAAFVLGVALVVLGLQMRSGRRLEARAPSA